MEHQWMMLLSAECKAIPAWLSECEGAVSPSAGAPQRGTQSSVVGSTGNLNPIVRGNNRNIVGISDLEPERAHDCYWSSDSSGPARRRTRRVNAAD